MDFLAYLIHLVTAHPFGFMAFVFAVIFGSAIFIPKDKYPSRWWYLILLITMVLNFIVGSWINSSIIYNVGETAKAQVTGVEGTSSQYNNQRVYRYNMLMKTADGQVIETYFDNDDFNIYPFRNSVSYPQSGDRFNVRYLKHFPSAFVIVSNDDSPWANDASCVEIHQKLAEAQNKYQFDRSNLTYQKKYILLIQQVITDHCYIDSLDLRKYYGDIELVKQGKDLNEQ